MGFLFWYLLEVEARPKEVIPVPGWFNNVEGFILPNLKAFQSTEPTYVNRHVETDEIVNSFKRKNNKKKRKKIVKKLAKKFKAIERKKRTKGATKKKKNKRNGSRLMFIKSDLNENDINDSNLSSAKEKQKKTKPVDIIVHIKMNND